LELPGFSAETTELLGDALPAYGHAQNPLDVTGAALADSELWIRAIDAIASDPAIGLIGAVISMPKENEPHRAHAFEAIGAGLGTVAVPGVVCPQMEQATSEHAREVKLAAGITNSLPSVERFVVAASGLAWWSRWLRSRQGESAAASNGRLQLTRSLDGPLSEHSARRLLAAAGVPAVPAELARSSQDAADSARRFASPVALKLCSPNVAHKTELGGVELGVTGDEAVSAAYERIVQRAASVPGLEVEGVLVSPMRSADVELLVGVVADPAWGQVLAVGFGGFLVEVLEDSALGILPVTRQDIREMLEGLTGFRLLTGYRGREPADLDALIDVIARIAELAEALGSAATSFEVNPLLVSGSLIEALDVLITIPEARQS
jgi:acyl-CoA synthetase (NDP forming)